MEKNKFEIKKSDIPNKETSNQESIEQFSNHNPYIVLGISENLSAKEIVLAWKRLILQFHPDKSKHPQAKEISQYLNRAIRKLVTKDGTLLNYNPNYDTEVSTDDEDIKDWEFGFPNISDEEWYAGDKYWEILNEYRQKNRVRSGLEDKEKLEKEKEWVLLLFEKYGDTQENLDNPNFNREKMLFHNTLITADIEDQDFRVVGYRHKIKNGIMENSINSLHQKENIWRLKERVYNQEGKIVIDGSKMEDPIHNSWESFENPPFLYHGTIEEKIEEFEPRSAIERPNEKPAVYASPDMNISIQSIANKYVSNGGIVNGKKFVCIPMSKKDFLKLDHGGYIYKLPGESFKPNKQKGFGEDLEWVSATAVKPVEKIKISSIFNALKEKDIEVYFIDKEMIPIIKEAQDSKPEKLEALLYDLKSKNLKE